MFRNSLFAACIGLVACGTPSSTTELPTAIEAVQAAAPLPQKIMLTEVTDRSQVCMVNNQFMGAAQIPIDIGGKTYFGCCEMCRDRLQSDASNRYAHDPVSGNTVDKADAVIGRSASGAVLYFESDETFQSYGNRDTH